MSRYVQLSRVDYDHLVSLRDRYQQVTRRVKGVTLTALAIVFIGFVLDSFWAYSTMSVDEWYVSQMGDLLIYIGATR